MCSHRQSVLERFHHLRAARSVAEWPRAAPAPGDQEPPFVSGVCLFWTIRVNSPTVRGPLQLSSCIRSRVFGIPPVSQREADVLCSCRRGVARCARLCRVLFRAFTSRCAWGLFPLSRDDEHCCGRFCAGFCAVVCLSFPSRDPGAKSPGQVAAVPPFEEPRGCRARGAPCRLPARGIGGFPCVHIFCTSVGFWSSPP